MTVVGCVGMWYISCGGGCVWFDVVYCGLWCGLACVGVMSSGLCCGGVIFGVVVSCCLERCVWCVVLLCVGCVARVLWRVV